MILAHAAWVRIIALPRAELLEALVSLPMNDTRTQLPRRVTQRMGLRAPQTPEQLPDTPSATQRLRL